MEEIWAKIPGFENYEVSNFGRVKSYCRYKEGRLLKFNKNYYGYLSVALCNNGKTKLTKVHRLVASVFLNNDNNLPQINHKDEDVTNNHVDNLEWCTAKYNINYGNRSAKMAKTQSVPVLQYNLDLTLLRKWDSIKEAADYLNIKKAGRGHITECCQGKRRVAYGYIWRYEIPK
nr:MAG: zinc-binding loop region of homing endonuclease [Bacteriophage sp.]